MTERLKLHPSRYADVYGAMYGLEAVVGKAGFEHSLLLLLKVRVSQLNGCGYCVDMHTKDARLEGETEQRLYLLNAWREAPMYSPRERAVLEWAEAVTKLENQHVPDEVYARAREQFSEEELVTLTLAVISINGWNRLAVSFNKTPGSYVAGSLRKLQTA